MPRWSCLACSCNTDIAEGRVVYQSQDFFYKTVIWETILFASPWAIHLCTTERWAWQWYTTIFAGAWIQQLGEYSVIIKSKTTWVICRACVDSRAFTILFVFFNIHFAEFWCLIFYSRTCFAYGINLFLQIKFSLIIIPEIVVLCTLLKLEPSK